MKKPDRKMAATLVLLVAAAMAAAMATAAGSHPAPGRAGSAHLLNPSGG